MRRRPRPPAWRSAPSRTPVRAEPSPPDPGRGSAAQPDPGARLVRHHDGQSLEPNYFVDAVDRCATTARAAWSTGWRSVLLAHCSGQGRSTSHTLPAQAGRDRLEHGAAARVPLLPSAQHQAADRRPSRRGRLACDVRRARGARPPVLITSFQHRADRLPAGRRRCGLDRSHPDLDVAVSGRAGTERRAVGSRTGEGSASLRSRLVASFNSGFQLRDSGGGFAIGGHTYAPMKDGSPTILRYRDGRVDLIDWTGGRLRSSRCRVRMPEPAADRQRRPAQPEPQRWPTMGRDARQRRTRWRSAVGMDRHGNLIYAAGPDQGVGVAGLHDDPRGRRARDRARHQHLLDELHHLPLPGCAGTRPTCSRRWTARRSRYLTPDDRDFFAVYVR